MLQDTADWSRNSSEAFSYNTEILELTRSYCIDAGSALFNVKLISKNTSNPHNAPNLRPKTITVRAGHSHWHFAQVPELSARRAETATAAARQQHNNFKPPCPAQLYCCEQLFAWHSQHGFSRPAHDIRCACPADHCVRVQAATTQISIYNL